MESLARELVSLLKAQIRSAIPQCMIKPTFYNLIRNARMQVTKAETFLLNGPQVISSLFVGLEGAMCRKNRVYILHAVQL